MTVLKKKLSRELEQVFNYHNAGRPIVIEIEPNGLVSFREKGRRTRWTASANWLMAQVIWAEMSRRGAERRKRRKARRKGLGDVKGSV